MQGAVRRLATHRANVWGALWALALLLTQAVGLPAMAQSAIVRVSPAQAETTVGQTVEVTIEISNVTDLVGLDLELTFDPLFLEMADADANTDGVQVLAGDLPYPDFVVRNEVDNSTGLVRYAITQLNPRTPGSGTGTAITLEFLALAEGSSAIAFQTLRLVDSQGVDIAAAATAGTVQITSLLPPGATPSRTPSATRTPTSLAPTGTTSAGDYPAPATSTTPAATATRTRTTLPTTPSATSTAGAYPGETPAHTATLDSASPEATTQPTRKPTRTGEPQTTTTGSPTAEPNRTHTLTPTPETGVTLPTPALSITPSPAPVMTVPLAPTSAAAQAETYPLIPQEIFVCLALLLILFTVLLFLYLTRQRNKPHLS